MNNLELVEYVKKCLELGENSVYVYGSWGNKLTASFCDNKYNQYPTVNTKARTAKYKKLCDGKHYGFDCVGLIKSYYWGGYGKAKYDSKTDVSANGMYNKAKVKGNISTIDKTRKGLLVQMDGHIGVYIGNDEVIECTISTKFAKQSHGLGGVCKTKLADRKWEHWLECPYIDYVEEKKAQGTITVAAGTWNVREGAGVQYKVVRVVKGGNVLEYYGIENGWYKLKDGYISSKAVKNNAAPTTTTKYYQKCNSKYNSIVDALKSIGVNSSFSNRKSIAKKNGIKVYLGTPAQNKRLLNLLKAGKLVK